MQQRHSFILRVKQKTAATARPRGGQAQFLTGVPYVLVGLFRRFTVNSNKNLGLSDKTATYDTRNIAHEKIIHRPTTRLDYIYAKPIQLFDRKGAFLRNRPNTPTSIFCRKSRRANNKILT